MIKFYKYLLIGLLSIPFTTKTSFSQTIDANRMNRDINIMENILSELFKAQISSSEEGAVVINGQGGYFRGNSTRGTYLPGFGVIFMVSNPGRNMYQISSGSGSSTFSFYYNSEEEEGDLEIDQESITKRIEEFLRDYSSTIGQLKNDEKVMVIHGSKSNTNSFFVRYPATHGQASSDKKEALPVISVSAKVSDLSDYRAGKLSADNFNKRLAVATSEDKEYLDLKVMGNIFETALKEQEKESFRLSGTVDYMMLDNFGALFSLHVRYNEFPRAASILWDEVGRLRSRIGSTERVVVEEARNNERKDPPNSQDFEERKKEMEENIATAYTNLVSNIKEYIVDYGRTLSSLSGDQFLLLSININGRYENVPGRLDIQVKKSVLEQLDKGSISREQAIQRVVVTEY